MIMNTVERKECRRRKNIRRHVTVSSDATRTKVESEIDQADQLYHSSPLIFSCVPYSPYEFWIIPYIVRAISRILFSSPILSLRVYKLQECTNVLHRSMILSGEKVDRTKRNPWAHHDRTNFSLSILTYARSIPDFRFSRLNLFARPLEHPRFPIISAKKQTLVITLGEPIFLRVYISIILTCSEDFLSCFSRSYWVTNCSLSSLNNSSSTSCSWFSV